MLKRIVNTIVLLSIACTAFSQLQPLLDHYYLNGLAINPAYAGSKQALNLGLFARKQWIGFEGAPRTFTCSMDSPLRNRKVNLGVLVVSDRVGSMLQTAVHANYAYRMEMDVGKLSFGIAAGVARISSDPSLIRYNDPGDVLLQNLSESSVLPNFGFGSYYYNSTYYLGVSIPEMVSHKMDEVTGKFNTTFDAAATNYILTGGYLFRLSEEFELLPTLLFKTNPANGTQLDVNCNLIFKEKIWLGAGVRTNGSITSALQLQVNPQLRIAYSYAYEFSELSSFQRGSHEIMLLYNFRYILDVLSPRYF